jgi:hypothetical protein
MLAWQSQKHSSCISSSPMMASSTRQNHIAAASIHPHDNAVAVDAHTSIKSTSVNPPTTHGELSTNASDMPSPAPARVPTPSMMDLLKPFDCHQASSYTLEDFEESCDGLDAADKPKLRRNGKNTGNTIPQEQMKSHTRTYRPRHGHVSASEHAEANTKDKGKTMSRTNVVANGKYLQLLVPSIALGTVHH